MEDTDEQYMQHALELARRGMGTASPNPMVGALLVRDGVILGEGWHVRAGEGHAEVNAFANAGERGADVHGATLYVTLEPCSTSGRTPPCTKAILASGVKKVVIGCMDPNPKHAGKAVSIMQDAGIKVVSGVLEKECQRLNEAFFHWITTSRPFVLLKMAETLDGRIAAKTGISQWITGPEARARVMVLRQWADAVMAGAGTFRKDSPRFTVRDAAGNVTKTPRRIIVTRHPENFAAEQAEGWEFVSLPDRAAWNRFLRKLGRENVTGLLIEGGGELAASALAAEVVNRIEFHIAPKILGGRESLPSIGGDSPENLEHIREITDMEIRQYGRDFAVTGCVRYK